LNVKFFFVILYLGYKEGVLRFSNFIKWKVAEKGHFRHQVNVWCPKRIFTQLFLIHDENRKRELLPVITLFAEDAQVFREDWTEQSVAETFVKRDYGRVGHIQEGFTVSYRLQNTCAYQSTLEKRRIL
jgi:hypothetical protein